MSAGQQEVHLEAVASGIGTTSASTAKPVVKSFSSRPKLGFSYSASPDGIDTNLLILLHGRGDNEQPFARLAKSLALPQTATLSLRGIEMVPLLEEHEREWWNETDQLGMGNVDVTNQDPGPAIKVLCDTISELADPPYNWSSENIHLFGFGQGGTLACESGQAYYKRAKAGLGSIVSVHGPLLSLPSSTSHKAPTLVQYVTRQYTSGKHQAEVAALERAYTLVQVVRHPGKQREVAMPKNKEEWGPVMKFWSERLQRKNAWELSGNGEVYEVTAGKGQVPLPNEGKAQQAKAVNQKTSTSTGQNFENEKAAVNHAGQDRPVKPVKPVSGLKRGFLSGGL